MKSRKSYPNGVSNAGLEFVTSNLFSLPLDAVQRGHDLREVFNGLR